MKMIKLLLLLSISVVCLFAFVSCGGKGETEPTESQCEHEWGEGKVLSDPTCVKEGTMFYKCEKCGEQKTEPIPPNGAHKYAGEVYYVKEPTATADGELCKLCSVCGAEKRESADYATYKKKYDAAVNGIAGFTASQFGGTDHTKLSTTAYQAPTENPTSGQHPRLLFTEADMATLRTAWHTPAYYNMIVKEIIEAGASSEKGVLSTPASGKANDSQSVLNVAIGKAFLYRFTRVRLYGYEAVLIAKNYLTTLVINDGAYGDPERNYGEAMFYIGLIYDWCYPLLTKNDKDQIIAGVQHNICEKSGMTREIGFPPSGQNPVAGHGSERQLLRDYLAFSIAIYDEEPTWYKFVGGRFFEEYVPVRNEYYKAGYYPQGISVYLSIRYCSDLWSAWIMKTATGKIPYDEANMKQVMRSVYSRIVDGASTFFEEGDDEARTHQENLRQFSLAAQISAYLFQDATVAAWAKYSDYSYTPFMFKFLTRAGTPEPAANRYDGMDLILYNGGWLGQIIAHTGWTDSAVTVQMKIGGYTTANHDHADAGSFQIYYRGLLAGDSGFYDSYNTTHWGQYHQSTIAHNSIVFCKVNSSGKTTDTLQQKRMREPGDYSVWHTSAYKMGTTTGYAYGYTDATKKTPVYAYIAGDIADAYNGVASEVTRRMLTVYDTGREDVKAYFFVFDHVTASDSYKSYQKTFLLHTLTEPKISWKTVTITSGKGKLVLQNLVGGNTVKAVGGANKNYVVNEEQLATKNGEKDGYWGRVEIATASGNATDTMLNVMYVCDSTTNVSLPAAKIQTNDLTGGVIGNTAAIFVTNAARRSTGFTFTTTGSGDLNYYVSGVAAGNWTVSVGGKTQSLTVSEESGLLTFTAPAGSVIVSRR
ncbi:MAG: heparinase II/III family protein [Clostridia bacterium]|nr:heparinase II/III family protein [Clostridia bacterium]